MQTDTPEQRPRTVPVCVNLTPKTVARTKYGFAHHRVKAVAKINTSIKGINL